jgi:hypothetical protein
MENILKVRYDKKINQHADVLVKHYVATNAGIEQKELFEEVDGKLVFEYDQEIGGETSIFFGEDEQSAFIEISSDYVCNVVLINEIVESALNFEEA